MNSKEALGIIVMYVPICFKEELETIERDLEVLEILKTSIRDKEKHIRRLSEPIGETFMMIYMNISGEENIKKVEKYLQDENTSRT